MRRCFLLGVILISMTAALARGATVDPPQRIKIIKLDKTELTGLITSFTEDDFDLMDAKKQTATLKWEELPPDAIMNLHDRLVRKGSGEQWLNLGKKLLTMPGGRAPGERAFQKALRAEPTLKDQVVEARKNAVLTPAPPRDPNAPRLTPTEVTGGGIPSTQPGGAEPTDPSKPVVGPKNVGRVDPSKWGKQTPEEMTAAVEDLKKFAEETKQRVNSKLVLYETQYFLFYSDLPANDAKNWSGLLDRMYAKLALLFGVPKGENIWRGKALVFVFSRDEDYFKFQMKMHDKTMAVGTAGMCHTFGNGDVHIAFFRQPNELDFAHVLVHESVHGFLHRYRSPIDIPSWINEGLAEVIASELVPRPGITQSSTAQGRQDLQTRRDLGKMFEEEHIVAWQYSVSRTMTEFMISQSRKGYVDFINGIKDGMPWEDALPKKYGVSLDQLVRAYGNYMGVPSLQP
ncbi:MAG: hypothetical protein QOE14_525 [Humisphaera sp.]|nr:hypothetical protein [Humisphaera sp.]